MHLQDYLNENSTQTFIHNINKLFTWNFKNLKTFLHHKKIAKLSLSLHCIQHYFHKWYQMTFLKICTFEFVIYCFFKKNPFLIDPILNLFDSNNKEVVKNIQ